MAQGNSSSSVAQRRHKAGHPLEEQVEESSVCGEWNWRGEQEGGALPVRTPGLGWGEPRAESLVVSDHIQR